MLNSSDLAMAGKPNVAKLGLFYAIFCMPKSITSVSEVLSIAEQLHSCGTTRGWAYYENGHDSLNGAEQDVTCQLNNNMKHVILVA